MIENFPALWHTSRKLQTVLLCCLFWLLIWHSNTNTIKHQGHIIIMIIAILIVYRHLLCMSCTLIWVIFKCKVLFVMSWNIMFIFLVADWSNHFNVPCWSQTSCNNPRVGCRPKATWLASYLCDEQGKLILPYFNSQCSKCDFNPNRFNNLI